MTTRNTALDWARRATTMKYLHFIVSQYYQKVCQYISAPSAVVMGGVGTGLIGVAAADSDELVAKIFLWILAVLSFLAGGLAAINWELDPSKLSERHLHKSVCWGDVADDLVLELSLNPEEQHDEKWFLSYIQKKMSLTENLPPVIPKWAFDLQPTHVMKGEMAKDLLMLDRRFGTVLGIFESCEPVSLEDHNSEVIVEVEDPDLQPVQPVHPLRSDPEPVSPAKLGDENSVLRKSLETEDYVDIDEMRNELQRKQREIRQDLKRRRREYHMNRLFGEAQFPMKPPPAEE